VFYSRYSPSIKLHAHLGNLITQAHTNGNAYTSIMTYSCFSIYDSIFKPFVSDRNPTVTLVMRTYIQKQFWVQKKYNIRVCKCKYDMHMHLNHWNWHQTVHRIQKHYFERQQKPRLQSIFASFSINQYCTNPSWATVFNYLNWWYPVVMIADFFMKCREFGYVCIICI
jgi:hypothetical protein